SGTPTSTGHFPIRLRASNNLASVTSPPIDLLIGSAPSVVPGTPPGGFVGATYSYPFGASGFPAPTFAVAQGDTLPPGLTLAPSGVLSGTPTATGTFAFTILASNFLDSAEDSVTISVIHATPPQFLASSPPTRV